MATLGLSGLALQMQGWTRRANAQTRLGSSSIVSGVQFGIQPFCYHDLDMTIANRPELLRRIVQNGLGMVELHAVWCEPSFATGAVNRQAAREMLREWRTKTSRSYYEGIRKEFNDQGVDIFGYWTGINSTHTEAEIHATFDAAKALGCRGVTGSQGLAMSAKLIPYMKEHGIFMGLHNHDNLSDPDALSNEASLGGEIALEAKAATPSAWAWARGDGSKEIHYQTILERAVRCPDPYVRLCGKWLVRQLAPDSSPIEIESLRGAGNQDRLLHAMAFEAANIHLGSAQARTRILTHLKNSSSKSLRTAVRDMAKTTIDDWKAWKKARR